MKKGKVMSWQHFSYIVVDWLEMVLLRCDGKQCTAHFGLATLGSVYI